MEVVCNDGGPQNWRQLRIIYIRGCPNITSISLRCPFLIEEETIAVQKQFSVAVEAMAKSNPVPQVRDDLCLQ